MHHIGMRDLVVVNNSSHHDLASALHMKFIIRDILSQARPAYDFFYRSGNDVGSVSNEEVT